MRALIIAIAFLAAAPGTPPPATADSLADRQAEVRTRGANVMPFSVGDTLHVFEKTEKGGRQMVTARPGHDEQIPMIRAHLRQIAKSFGDRDFSQPARIHGDDMPGLAELRGAGPAEITTAYQHTERGGMIFYAARTDALRDALHQWFDAQLADHGHDASDHEHGVR